MKKLYAIRDRLANELVGLRMYTVMCFRTNEEATRYFADAINDPTSILNKHPADYELLHLGLINDNGYLGGVDGVPTKQDPVIIVTGDTVLALQTPSLVKDA